MAPVALHSAAVGATCTPPTCRHDPFLALQAQAAFVPLLRLVLAVAVELRLAVQQLQEEAGTDITTMMMLVLVQRTGAWHSMLGGEGLRRLRQHCAVFLIRFWEPCSTPATRECC